MSSQDSSQPDYIELSPQTLDLMAKSDAIVRMGQMMLSAGTGSYRIKEAMSRVGRALGIDEIDAQVTLSEIVATMRKGNQFRTQVVDMPVPGVNVDRLQALEAISINSAPGMTVAQLHAKLDAVEHRRRLYRPWIVMLAAAMACASFAFLNNGTWIECLGAGVAAGIGKLAQIQFGRMRINQLAVTFLAAVTACLVYVLASTIYQAVLSAPSPLHSAAYTSTVLFLVPGFPLITAALDIARLDFASGVYKIAYAVTIVLSASLGAWLVAALADMTPVTPAKLDLPLSIHIAFWILASFCGVLGFALTFNTPTKTALWAACIAAIANPLRQIALYEGLLQQVAATVATIIVGVLAWLLCKWIKVPRIALTVPAVLIMIPGAAAYRALVYFNDGNTVAALGNAVQATVVVMSLAVGLAIARMLTDPEWAIAKPKWALKTNKWN